MDEEDSGDVEWREEVERMVEGLVAKQIKESKRKAKEQAKLLKSDYEARFLNLSAQLSTAKASLADLRDDFKASESIRESSSKLLLRQQASLSDASDKVDRFTQEFAFLQNSLVHLAAELASKASIHDIERLQGSVAVLCPMLYVQKLEMDVKDKANAREFRNVSEDVRSIQRSLSTDFVTKEGVMDCVQLALDKLTSAVKSSISVAQFAAFKQDLDRILQGIQTQERDLMTAAQGQYQEFKSTLMTIKEEITRKATISSVTDLKTRVETCALGRNLTATNEAVERNFLRTEDLAAELERSILRHEEVLQRYDEILLDKANKTALSVLELRAAKLEEMGNLRGKVGEVEGNLKGVRELQIAFQQRIDDLTRKMTDMKATIKHINSEKRDYFALFSSLKSLEEQLYLKADKADLASMYDSKSSKSETQAVTRSLEVLSRVDKLLIILLHHTIKCMAEMTEEVSPLSLPAADWLLKHAEMVSAWASLYEPIENEIELPPDIVSLLGTRKAAFKAPSLSPLSRTKSPLGAYGQGSGRLPRKLLFPRFDPRRSGLGIDTSLP